MGCTINPVMGAAIHRMGISSTLAPNVSKIRLTFAFCRAKPNWIPRKPKLMFQISQKESRLFFITLTLIHYFVDPLTTNSVLINRLTIPGLVSLPSIRLISSLAATSPIR